ncbi:MAG TPA: hypothetical protein VK149_01490 [Sideroxyarcus sp.]|nr:hypothetical protein [Sideroxyarcus sp.]
MSETQNLAYAVVQVLHNFGAVAAVGGSFAAAIIKPPAARKKVVWIALSGWVVQGASGGALGAVSYYFYHRLPDIAGIALAALLVKMACAAAGSLVLAAYLYWGERWPEQRGNWACHASLLLAVTALTAAAFLRWFS